MAYSPASNARGDDLMAKYDKISPETQQEAMKIARANQKPGQTK